MLKRIRFFITSWLLLCVFLISGCGTTQTTSQTKYSLSLEKTTYNLLDGEQAALRINFTADGKEADWALLTFESDNESVATVSGEGKITAVSEGTANVTVTHAEKSVTECRFLPNFYSAFHESMFLYILFHPSQMLYALQLF